MIIRHNSCVEIYQIDLQAKVFLALCRSLNEVVPFAYFSVVIYGVIAAINPRHY